MILAWASPFNLKNLNTRKWPDLQYLKYAHCDGFDCV